MKKKADNVNDEVNNEQLVQNEQQLVQNEHLGQDEVTTAMTALNEQQIVDNPQQLNQNGELSVNSTLNSEHHHAEVQMEDQDGNILETSAEKSIMKINSQEETSNETNKVRFVVITKFSWKYFKAQI